MAMGPIWAIARARNREAFMVLAAVLLGGKFQMSFGLLDCWLG
jgi:hypothetical protein